VETPAPAPAAPVRDAHLFGPGPKRILSLDGGGTLGVVALAFLARMEAVLRARHGGDPGFRLAHYFDLIGGTSTGAIIAAGLALGRSVAEMTALYLELGPRVFRPRWVPLPGLRPRFDHGALDAILRRELGERTLDSPDLLTGFALVAKRLDTGSPWLLSNSPRAPYWESVDGGATLGNRHYGLAPLVRASAAAPFYFAPQLIRVAEGQPPGLFIDGGVSPYNTPALALLMLATLGTYGLRWELGEDRLLLISVGTGLARPRLDPRAAAGMTPAGLAIRALAGMIADTQYASLLMLQWLSEPVTPWRVNSEVGDMRGEVLGGRTLLSFGRFDMPLEQAWLEAEMGISEAPARLEALRRFDVPGHMPHLHDMARRAAERQVDGAAFPAAFDLPAG
jgi:hypothetical protein